MVCLLLQYASQWHNIWVEFSSPHPLNSGSCTVPIQKRCLFNWQWPVTSLSVTLCPAYSFWIDHLSLSLKNPPGRFWIVFDLGVFSQWSRCHFLSSVLISCFTNSCAIVKLDSVSWFSATSVWRRTHFSLSVIYPKFV